MILIAEPCCDSGLRIYMEFLLIGHRSDSLQRIPIFTPGVL